MQVAKLVEELSDHLDLKGRAQSDGMGDSPPTDATTLTPAENAAIAAADAEAQKEIQAVEAGGAQTRHAIKDCHAALHEVANARKDIEGDRPPAAVDLDHLAQQRDGDRVAYNKFKADHKRMGNVADDDRAQQVTWAVVVVVCESLFNAYFYTPLSDLGFVGGSFIAFFVSFVNVLLAFLGGVWGLRFLGHVEPAKKLAGLVAFIVCALGCLAVVALSALFRGHVDAMATEDLSTEQLADQAWQASIDSLLQMDVLSLLGSLNSFLLLFVGLICMALGFWKGWEYDDPYPGFGRAYRKMEKSQEAYNEAKEQEDERQHEWEQDHKRRLTEEGDRLDRAKAKMEGAYIGLKASIPKAPRLASDAEKLAEGLLSIYRQENAKTRASRPPDYFEDYSIPFEHLDGDLRDATRDLADIEEERQRLIDRCEAEQEHIQAAIVRTPSGVT